MAAVIQPLSSDEDRLLMVARCQADPGFRDALLVQTYSMVAELHAVMAGFDISKLPAPFRALLGG